LSAKRANLKGIVWVGVVLFQFGLVSLLYPRLKVIVGSVMTSTAILVGGQDTKVLPLPAAGNEL